MDKKEVWEFNDENFDKEVLQSDKPVLIDFWASWCGPCRMVSPIVEELANEYKHQAKIGKLNVDRNMEIPNHYQVRSIPTIILFDHGREIDRIVGATSKSSLVLFLNRALKGKE